MRDDLPPVRQEFDKNRRPIEVEKSYIDDNFSGFVRCEEKIFLELITALQKFKKLSSFQ